MAGFPWTGFSAAKSSPIHKQVHCLEDLFTISHMNASPSGLSRFLDRRHFMRNSIGAGIGLYLATSKGAIAAGEQAGRVIKCALVGCGAQGDRLRASANQIKEGIQWVATCDIWERNSKKVATYMERENKHQVNGKVPYYERIEEMLEKHPEIEAVFIATPDFLHAPYSRLCLEKGKAVYCEKMMSNTGHGESLAADRRHFPDRPSAPLESTLPAPA
jgi:hypothetical protein